MDLTPGFISEKIIILDSNLSHGKFYHDGGGGEKIMATYGGETDKIFVDRQGEVEEFSAGSEKRRHVRFPVCLAVMYNGDVPEVCLDFILNVSKGGLFIKTDFPFPKGSSVIIHIYIPPETKLLGVFEGKVVEVRDDDAYMKGMHVMIMNSTSTDMKRLEDYMEEKRHLFDKEA